jgi:hypothetical protein
MNIFLNVNKKPIVAERNVFRHVQRDVNLTAQRVIPLYVSPISGRCLLLCRHALAFFAEPTKWDNGYEVPLEIYNVLRSFVDPFANDEENRIASLFELESEQESRYRNT